jgi:hypothetical protein
MDDDMDANCKEEGDEQRSPDNLRGRLQWKNRLTVGRDIQKALDHSLLILPPVN